MRDQTVLCIESSSRWNSLWRDAQQIMSRLAVKNRVLFFEPGRDSGQPVAAEMVRNLRSFFGLRCHQPLEQLYVVETPSSLPYARRHLPRTVLKATMPIVARINSRIRLRQIRRAVEAFGVRDPILWLYDPLDVHLIGHCGEMLVCYFNYDELPDFAHNAHIRDLVQRWDNELVRRADVVFATSRAQTERRRAINPRTFFVPNGVDFDAFNRALDPALPLPGDIAAIPRPIIGFAGWLGYHIDVPLLVRIADTFRHCRLVLVGPEELPRGPDRDRLRQMPNVSFLGRKDRAELPSYLKAFDVALMPWSLDGHIRSAYPLKLHEYLAAGRASVATALPELLPFADVVRIAQSHDEFLGCVGEALGGDGPEAIAARVDVARQNTWDQRVAEIGRILEPYLSRAQAGGRPRAARLRRGGPAGRPRFDGGPNA